MIKPTTYEGYSDETSIFKHLRNNIIGNRNSHTRYLRIYHENDISKTSGRC